MLTHHPSYTKPNGPKKITFSLLSPEDIRKMSVVKITDSTIYYRGLPNSGGINDALMGTVDRRLLCGTCMKDVKMCQGHAGHIELPYPMYHIGFFDTILKILRMVCFSCCKLSVTEAEIRNSEHLEQGKNRFTTIYNILKARKKCHSCGMMKPNYIRQSLSIKIDWPSEIEWESEEEKTYCNQPFTAREALSIMTHISDDDYRVMGFEPNTSHPKNMILTALVVPPPVTRPAIMQSEGSRSRGQNDLTLKLQDINKRCADVVNTIGENWNDVEITSEIVEKLGKLQFEVFTLVNNSVRGQKQSTQRSGAPIKALIDRIKGKDGRIRGNLMGKRVDFSSRSVISPCPYMDIDCVGVPEKIAVLLTFPEKVTKYNIETLTDRVKKGAGVILGAETIITTEGKVIQLNFCKKNEDLSLKPGDIVERYLQDNDIVVFNRQPSLHKMGMMAHRVKLMDGYTFRLNLVCTSSYNADFDGDEMNLHVPQSAAAMADAALLMMVTQQIISPQSNKPVIGIVQDSLLGGYLLTQDDVLLSHKHACQCCATLCHTPKNIGKPAVIMRGKKFWTGKQLMSILLPTKLMIDNSNMNDIGKEEENDVIIRNGKLLYGILTKKMLGTAAGGIIDVSCREFGNEVASRFMSDEQRMTNSYLLIKGFSVGVSDCILSEEGHQKVNERLEKATSLCEEIMSEVQQKDTPVEVKQTAESTIMKILSKTLMQTGSIVNECMGDNAIRKMVDCGSKGTPINLSQICGTVGQQSVEGGRIKAEKGSRTLPCFSPNECTLSSQGFVHNSYALGLTPSEFFYHAMGGREGLVDTAVKTSVTGYIQRRQIKSMEDCKVNYDGTVREALDGIVDFLWGGDGMDSSKLERSKLRLLSERTESMKNRMTPTEFGIALRAKKNLLNIKLLPTMPSLDTRVLLPFNPRRMVQTLIFTDNPELAVGKEKAEEGIMKLLLICNTNVLRAAVLDNFCSDAMKNVHKEDYEKLMTTIVERINRAKINPGEMVGCLAAQSVSEPCTQMTLNSVDWNTHMAIHWTASMPPPAPQDAEVGGFIDALIDQRSQDVQLQPDGVTVYLPLPKGTAIALSPDEDGNMMWTELEAVTRHPPINKDGTNTLCKVTTRAGHDVTVTKGKSLLVERQGKLVEVNGSDVKIGDRVPIVQELPDTNIIHLDMHAVFYETEAVFTDTMLEAIDCSAKEYSWFKNNNFKYRSCYNRSDSLMDAMKKRPELKTPGMVAWTQGRSALLPVKLPLDREFGFFIGAYLAEGCLTKHQVHIANVDPNFRNACKVWADRHGINSHITKEEHQKKNNGTSISIMFHSTILVQLLNRTCGKTSYGKRVPSFAFVAPKLFVEGLLDGYISGDGTISNKQAEMHAYSRSKSLRDGIVLLLTRFGITASLSHNYVQSHIKWSTTEDGIQTQELYGGEKPLYSLRLNAINTSKFAESVGMILEYKQHRLNEIMKSTRNKVKTNDRLKNVYLDEITGLEDISSSHEFVYDLTVGKTRNMTTIGGFGLRDTFHTAGIGSKNVTLGIPRLKELLDVSKNPKTPSTIIRFQKPFSQSESFVTYFANTLPLTRLGDLVTQTDIIHDPDFYKTTIKEDEWMVNSESVLFPDSVEEYSSCYIARLQMNQNLMKTRFLTPPMIRSLLRKRLGDRAQVISSEINSIDWIIRIRFSRVAEMMRAVGMTSDREAVLCHRVTSSLLETMAISGHPSIQTASCTETESQYMDENYNVVTEKEYVINTLGCCIIDISASPCIDWERTTTNDITELVKCMGLEAAAHQLFEQLNTVVSFDGTYVDPRHLTMLVNTMCKNGGLMALNRHGINRSNTGPLGKCSFEETPDVLCDAAMYGESDNANGVSTSIMTGQLARIGSGCCDILFNTNCLDVRNLDFHRKTRKKILKSTMRSHVENSPMESVEYVHESRSLLNIRTEIQMPFEDMEEQDTSLPFVEEKEEDKNWDTNNVESDIKRVSFRPRSPSK
jgi:DNA-directed RNA polymerase II subunit RPB1